MFSKRKSWKKIFSIDYILKDIVHTEHRLLWLHMVKCKPWLINHSFPGDLSKEMQYSILEEVTPFQFS